MKCIIGIVSERLQKKTRKIDWTKDKIEKMCGVNWTKIALDKKKSYNMIQNVK